MKRPLISIFAPAFTAALAAAAAMVVFPSPSVAQFAGTATTQPATKPAATAVDEDNGQPPVLWPTVRTAVKLSMKDRMLAMSTDLPRLGPQARHIKVADWPGRTFAVVDQRGGGDIITLQHELPTAGPDDDVMYSVSMMQQDDVRLSMDSEDKKLQKSVQFLQTPTMSRQQGEKAVRMVIYTDDLTSSTRLVNLRLEANDVVELREKYPRETAEYLQPLLAALGQEDAAFTVDHRVAWQVLAPQWPVDPQMQAKVQKLVADLDADDYATRTSANGSLARLGEPAAMVILRMDWSTFSLEQRNRLAALLTPYQPLSDADALAKASDVPFLLDCLYTDDVAVRATALKLLNKSVGKTLPLDANASHGDWLNALRPVRAQLLVGPTTQPGN